MNCERVERHTCEYGSARVSDFFSPSSVQLLFDDFVRVAVLQPSSKQFFARERMNDYWASEHVWASANISPHTEHKYFNILF